MVPFTAVWCRLVPKTRAQTSFIKSASSFVKSTSEDNTEDGGREGAIGLRSYQGLPARYAASDEMRRLASRPLPSRLPNACRSPRSRVSVLR